LGAAPRIDVELVRRLIAAQLPRWAHLPIEPIVPGGWDNRTFRLGGSMTVRLPSAEGYALQVEKEQHWLPLLAPQLPLPIPSPLAAGHPDENFPWAWSVNEWIEGDIASPDRIRDLPEFARDVAGFLARLRDADATDGPLPGPHNFYRGASPEVYDTDVWHGIESLGGSIDSSAVREVWVAALDSRWQSTPVWLHGDISVGNLLLRDGQLSAVIDFGTSGVGDPACDLVIAFTLFEGASRDAFRSSVQLDEETWRRARGWAIWKALIVAAGFVGAHSPGKESFAARRVIDEVVADHRRSD
jgi:aminoglycoside phosphotransferase (APT) family kinase protein